MSQASTPVIFGEAIFPKNGLQAQDSAALRPPQLLRVPATPKVEIKTDRTLWIVNPGYDLNWSISSGCVLVSSKLCSVNDYMKWKGLKEYGLGPGSLGLITVDLATHKIPNIHFSTTSDKKHWAGADHTLARACFQLNEYCIVRSERVGVRHQIWFQRNENIKE